MEQYDLVRVKAIRGNRFAGKIPLYTRNPAAGDSGTILELFSNPEPAILVECSDEQGITIWLEVMYPEELTPVGN